MGLADIIYPKKCLDCKKRGVYICSSCLAKLRNVGLICPVCRKVSIDGKTHVKCTKPRSLDGLVSVWPYEGVVRRAILALKYGFAKEIAKDFAYHIKKVLDQKHSLLLGKHLLIVIPLHHYRKNWRGFNQADEIAKILVSEMGWDYVRRVLVRSKIRKPQTELRKEQRTGNIEGVFKLNPKTSPKRSNIGVILFDDVWTTGSTLKEACKVLKMGGFNKVWGLTIAR
jgi:ComF family protein